VRRNGGAQIKDRQDVAVLPPTAATVTSITSATTKTTCRETGGTARGRNLFPSVNFLYDIDLSTSFSGPQNNSAF
jgi:hypothetical protein